MKVSGLVLLGLISASLQAETVDIDNDLNYYVGEKRVIEETSGMQRDEGSTLFAVDGMKIRVIAEQRTSDKLVQVVIMPDKGSELFRVTGVRLSLIRGQGSTNVVAYVKALYTKTDPKESNRPLSKMIPVFVKPVEAFSISYDEAKEKNYIVMLKRLPQML